MKRLLNVAVFGFSLNVLEQLKSQILQSIPAGVTVEWVNISEQKIDLLMVNDLFFHSANIQKVVENQVSEYLRLIKDIDRSGEIQADTLCYPLYHQDHFSDWIQERFFEYESYTGRLASQKATALQSDIDHVITEMFVPRNGFIQIYDQNGFLALVDCMTERVWVETRLQPQLACSSLNYTYATGQFVNEVIRNKQAQDLRTWLWRNYIQLGSVQPNISAKQCFKLDIWPQFHAAPERRNLMKMAACFAHGAKLKDVAQTLNVDLHTVESFVHKAQQLKFGRWIDSDEAQFHVQSAETSSGAGQSIRNFFGKLRKKFGL